MTTYQYIGERPIRITVNNEDIIVKKNDVITMKENELYQIDTNFIAFNKKKK